MTGEEIEKRVKELEEIEKLMDYELTVLDKKIKKYKRVSCFLDILWVGACVYLLLSGKELIAIWAAICRISAELTVNKFNSKEN